MTWLRFPVRAQFGLRAEKLIGNGAGIGVIEIFKLLLVDDTKSASAAAERIAATLSVGGSEPATISFGHL